MRPTHCSSHTGARPPRSWAAQTHCTPVPVSEEPAAVWVWRDPRSAEADEWRTCSWWRWWWPGIRRQWWWWARTRQSWVPPFRCRFWTSGIMQTRSYSVWCSHEPAVGASLLTVERFKNEFIYSPRTNHNVSMIFALELCAFVCSPQSFASRLFQIYALRCAPLNKPNNTDIANLGVTTLI